MSASPESGPLALSGRASARRASAAGVALLLSLGWGVGAPGTAAQAPAERLRDACAGGDSGGTELAGRCADAALAVQALHGGLGLLLTAGGPVPASPSTAGRRMATAPRVVVDVGMGWASFRHPDLRRAGSGPIPERRSFPVAARLTTAVGLFEGFSPIPTVGGVLAVDAVGTGQILRLSRSDGFGGSVAAWGAGVRVGVFRESFTLPGVTLSAMHHRASRVRYGDRNGGGEGAHVALNPRATSYRAVVGKDLLAVGLSAGVGWDRYRGPGRIEARITGSGSTEPRSGVGGFEALTMNRRYLFAGANFTWVVAQAAGELTWARTGTPLADIEGTGRHRAGARELQGAVTFRITY